MDGVERDKEGERVECESTVAGKNYAMLYFWNSYFRDGDDNGVRVWCESRFNKRRSFFF